jgi:hypothetical protein
VSLVRRGCRLGRRCLSGDRLTFRPGRRPRMLVQRPWSTNSLPCAAWAAGGWVVRCCGLSSSGGAPGRRSRKEVLLFGEAAPKGVHRDLVSSGRRGLLDAGCWRRVALLFWRIDFFIFVGASRVYSSHSTHGVFSLALVRGRLVWVEWCCVGCAPVVSVLARFPVD